MSVRVSVAAIALLGISGCAGVDPNPNIGLRTTDLVFSRGDCEGAKAVAESHALRGEPWAQLRMGQLLVDEKCPGRPDTKALVIINEAMSWWKKAGCYESKSAWERGSPLSVGLSGYYNARAASTDAARLMAWSYGKFGKARLAWVWINHASQQYDDGDPVRTSLIEMLREIESTMTPDEQAKVKGSGHDPCKSQTPDKVG